MAASLTMGGLYRSGGRGRAEREGSEGHLPDLVTLPRLVSCRCVEHSRVPTIPALRDPYTSPTSVLS